MLVAIRIIINLATITALKSQSTYNQSSQSDAQHFSGTGFSSSHLHVSSSQRKYLPCLSRRLPPVNRVRIFFSPLCCKTINFIQLLSFNNVVYWDKRLLKLLELLGLFDLLELLELLGLLLITLRSCAWVFPT